jgi:hypothetical protein
MVYSSQTLLHPSGPSNWGDGPESGFGMGPRRGANNEHPTFTEANEGNKGSECARSRAEWTKSGVLRHAEFIGVRDDMDPKQVVRE